jgi:tetraacyldisaccharide 4'-kinase
MLKIYNYFLYAWYRYPGLFIVLWPFSLIYRFIIFIRRLCYQFNLFKKYRAPVPVIVVGNFVVGGTGKTPMVIALAQLLKQSGYKPGIITRGYGSDETVQNVFITKETDPKIAGDEPVLMAMKTDSPIIKNKNRAQAAQQLSTLCDIIISDDGLQHYRLNADIKIAMQANKKWLRNHFCLPAGPWREPLSRLSSVDFTIEPQVEIETDLSSLKNKTVHAVCAIASPWRFFKMLNDFGIQTINHAYPDHYLLSEENLTFSDNIPVLITEKDAVKCKNFNLSNVLIVKIKTQLDKTFTDALLNKIQSRIKK